MAAKRSLRDAMQEGRSAVWSFHSSDERRRSAPAKALPTGFRRTGPDYFVARLANALRAFGAARAASPSQCVRNAAHEDC